VYEYKENIKKNIKKYKKNIKKKWLILPKNHAFPPRKPLNLQKIVFRNKIQHYDK